jgi:2-polyprenyl-3-methyl-5-hydroxy-6-metoxy-1,4-benzoquinol methylase
MAAIAKSRLVHIPACKICGSASAEMLLSTDFHSPQVWGFLETYYQGRLDKQLFEGLKFEVLKCRACDFLWQANVGDPELLGQLYGSWISAEDSLAKKRNLSAEYFRNYALQVQGLAQLLPKKPIDTEVLDFGMGWGMWCLMAKAHGYSVTGLEISTDRIAFARSNGITVVEDLSRLEGKRFDFINSEQVFEHLDDPLGTLKSAVTLLKPGGFIRISVPDGSGMEAGLRSSGWKAAKDALHPLEHINCYTETSLRKLGEAAGLRRVREPVVPHDLKSLVKSFLGRFLAFRQGTAQYFTKA